MPIPGARLVKAEPSIAGKSPVNCAEGRLVKFAPEAAGSVAGNLASGTVPESSSDAFKLTKLDPSVSAAIVFNVNAVPSNLPENVSPLVGAVVNMTVEPEIV